MKNLLAFTVPILPGKTAQFKKFINELNHGKFRDFVESRKKLGVRERTFLQTTPHGDFVVVTLEGNNPQEALSKFGAGTDAFTKFFVKEVKEIHGIDLTSTTDKLTPELLIDSSETVLQN